MSPSSTYCSACLSISSILQNNCMDSRGSMAALTNMLFPSSTIAEGIAKDFAPDSHILLRLRILHPILSILTAVYLIFLAGWLKSRTSGSPDVVRWSNILSVTVLIQIAFGAATLLMLSPIVMQLGHLFLADAVWIGFVLMSTSVLWDTSTKFE